MSRQRLAFAWIACFAVLFNMLAMPLSGAIQRSDSGLDEQLLWGSFCSSTGTKLVAISLGKLDQQAPQNDDHSTMQHCWCCSGSPPLVALPGHVPQLSFTRFAVQPGAPQPQVERLTLRQQWPSLNPGAPPLA
ncbi:DUF2946 domain-containing protein [Pseudomonas sp. SIMBA_021]|jgi:hypothetical protein|uniref:DUF2946 domain-containing protein n=1 Tax=unclassified Pseudomonas TaxID=196821 RepID=UPI00397E3DC7